MSIIQSDLLLGQEGSSKYQVSRSLRFSSGDSSYLSRTPASAGNRKTWTWSGWVKLCAIPSTYFMFFSAGAGGSDTGLIRLNYENSGKLNLAAWNTDPIIRTAAVYRDFSAWYHIVVAVDTANATASNRAKIYINGIEAAYDSDNRSSISNLDTPWNNNVAHTIGTGSWTVGSSYYANAYFAEIHNIDGQALTPSSFAETDATTGQWIPKSYSGSKGSNGFHLEFADNSAATATTLGKDSAGSNNWTPNNFSVTAGAGNDSLVDTPTSYGTDTGAGSEVRGNYCTFNPLASTSALSNGNLDTTMSAYPTDYGRGTIGIASGKYYFEATVTSGGQPLIGISPYGSGGSIGNFYGYHGAGYIYGLGGYVGPPDTPYTVGDIIGIAIDITAGSIKFYKNNSLVYTFTGIASSTYFPFYAGTNGGSTVVSWNFGQRSWAYQAPAGFKALVDTNLTAPVIAKPNTVMDVALYTGNGSGANTFLSTGPTVSTGFSPDLVWIKSRSLAKSHVIHDTVRGETKRLYSDLTNGEFTYDHNKLAFNSNGIQITTNDDNYNNNNSTYAAWLWDAGTSTVTNTQGSIISSCRTNQSSGLSIVSFTPASSGAFTVGHNLNATPSLVIAKSRNRSVYWFVYHSALTSPLGKFLGLNATDAVDSNYASFWGTTAFSSTVFGMNTGVSCLSSDNMIAYCFAPVSGYSSFGSYTGNGSSDGPAIWLGFRPALLIIKNSSATNNWVIFDSKRDGYNVNNDQLYPNTSAAEDDGLTYTFVDLLSNGFKLRNTATDKNGSGGTYIYCAWAESPFQYARAR